MGRGSRHSWDRGVGSSWGSNMGSIGSLGYSWGSSIGSMDSWGSNLGYSWGSSMDYSWGSNMGSSMDSWGSVGHRSLGGQMLRPGSGHGRLVNCNT